MFNPQLFVKAGFVLLTGFFSVANVAEAHGYCRI